MSDAPSPRTKLRRNAIRAEYDIEAICGILDSEMLCHVAYVEDGEPRMVPTLYIRIDDELFMHGNRQSAMLRHVEAGGLVNVSVMIADGIVVARSGFHCSMNYRSVSVFGTGRVLADDEHRSVLDAFVERLIPGHLSAVRAPTAQELAATTVVAVPIDESSAKVRAGGPNDDASDLRSDTWAGVLPLSRVAGEAIAADDLKATLATPEYISGFRYPGHQ